MLRCFIFDCNVLENTLEYHHIYMARKYPLINSDESKHMISELHELDTRVHNQSNPGESGKLKRKNVIFQRPVMNLRTEKF